MIFIYENQFPAPEQPNKKSLKALAYKEAAILYKSLFRLPGKTYEEIETITFIVNADHYDAASFTPHFKHFSADIEDSPLEKELMYEIWNWFPGPHELLDRIKREAIENLIKNLSVVPVSKKGKSIKNFGRVTGTGSCCFISSLIKGCSLLLLEELSEDSALILCDSSSAKSRSDGEHRNISWDTYLNINKLLAGIRRYNSGVRIEPWKIRDYKPGDPLNYFSNTLLDKLVSLVGDLRKNVHFFGKDTLLANRAIEMLLRGEQRIYYSMPTDLKSVHSENKAVIIQNFDCIIDSHGYQELHERVKSIESVFYVILQALRNVNSKYFSYYENIEIPNPPEIRKHITGIFLSLLIDHNLYRDDYWKLYSLVHGNLLEKLIPETENLEILSQCLRNFHPLTYDDLMFNIGFWFMLQSEVLSLLEAKRNETAVPAMKSLLFIKEEDIWVIEGLGKTINLPERQFIGLIYLLIIIEAKRELSSTEIIDISIRYRNNDSAAEKRQQTIQKWGKDKYGLLESDRSTVSGAISRFKNYAALHDFIRDHITASKGMYFYNHKNKYEAEVQPKGIVSDHL